VELIFGLENLILPLAILSLMMLVVVWLFFQAAKPENKRIQNERAPTIIELSWLVPLLVIAISTGGAGIVTIVPLFFVRMDLEKLYQIFNPDWREDGTTTGVPVLEKAAAALKEIPSPDEVAQKYTKKTAEYVSNEYSDKNSPIRLFMNGIRSSMAPFGRFHDRHHDKAWFVILAYLVILSICIPLLILSIALPELLF
jgi:hypothetical protein